MLCAIIHAVILTTQLGKGCIAAEDVLINTLLHAVKAYGTCQACTQRNPEEYEQSADAARERSGIRGVRVVKPELTYNSITAM